MTTTEVKIEWEATQMRDGKWCVRPKGELGTIGWHPIPWTARYVSARNADDAVAKATGHWVWK